MATDQNSVELKRKLLADLNDRNYYRCEQDFFHFFKNAWSVLEPNTPLLENWHQGLIAETLQACLKGQIKRLIVNIPPRYTKSTLCTITFPCWVWVNDPSVRFMIASYSGSLSTKHSIDRRALIESQWYQTAWQTRFSLDDDQNTKTEFQNDKRGVMVATSLRGTATGKGGDCIAGGQKVLTISGWKPIESIQIGEFVLTHKCRWMPVQAVRKINSKKTLLVTGKGGIISCTNDHRFLTPKSWMAAKDARIVYQADMRALWEAVHPKGPLAWKAPYSEVLLHALLAANGERPAQTEPAQMQEVRNRDCRQARQTVLFQEMQRGPRSGNRLSAVPSENCLRRMSEDISAPQQSNKVLFKTMRESRPLKKNGGGFESELAAGRMGSAQQSVFQGEEIEGPSAWGHLCRMRVKGQSCRTSPGRESEERLDEKSYRALHLLPSVVSSHQESGTKDVFDLQVAGDHSFICEGFVVHNCLIIDDPHDPLKAQSELERASDIEAYDTKFSTRLDNKESGIIIVVMQRLHQADLTGHLLKQGGWHHLCLPARAERHQTIIFPMSGKVMERKPGEILHPERESEKQVDEMKIALGPYGFSGQYQQLPSPREGGILKRDAWRRYVQRPVFDYLFQSWDANIVPDGSSYAVGMVVGVKGASRYVLEINRGKWGFDELIRKFLNLTDDWPKAFVKLVENKANGPAMQSVLKEKVPGIILVEPEGGKESRALAAEPALQAGNWFIPDPSLRLWWVDGFVEECAAFPNGENDDMVDAWSQAEAYVQKRIGQEVDLKNQRQPQQTIVGNAMGMTF